MSGQRCYGIARPHDDAAAPFLYQLGPLSGRRAFLCDGCADELRAAGVDAIRVVMTTRALPRRAGVGRRTGDRRLGNTPSDRRAP